VFNAWPTWRGAPAGEQKMFGEANRLAKEARGSELERRFGPRTPRIESWMQGCDKVVTVRLTEIFGGIALIVTRGGAWL
jgi:hypothetical protein